MLKDNAIKKILITAFIILDLGIIIFGLLAFLDWHLILGWVWGGLATIFGYIVSVFLIGLVIKKSKSKTVVFWLAWLKGWVLLAWHAISFIFVILVNTSWSNEAFKANAFSDITNPVNIVTYICGVSIIMVSTLVIHIFKTKGGKDGQNIRQLR